MLSLKTILMILVKLDTDLPEYSWYNDHGREQIMSPIGGGKGAAVEQTGISWQVTVAAMHYCNHLK